jgi:hypothetical protein
MLILLALLLLGAPARAQSVADGLAEAVAKRIQQNPERFLDRAETLILGHGEGGAIGAAEVEGFVALERAAARAGALRRLLAVDLDADGAVAAEEVALAARAAGAEGRARLLRAQAAADGDGDGTVSAGELGLWAEGQARAAFSPADEGEARAILAFDGNADGRVTLTELRAGLAVLADGA